MPFRTLRIAKRYGQLTVNMIPAIISPVLYCALLILMGIVVRWFPYYGLSGYNVVVDPIVFSLAIGLANYGKLSDKHFKFGKIGSLIVLMLGFYFISFVWSHVVHLTRGYELHSATQPFWDFVPARKNFSNEVLIAATSIPAILSYYYLCTRLFSNIKLENSLRVIVISIPLSIFLIYTFAQGAYVICSDALGIFQTIWPLFQCLFLTIAIQSDNIHSFKRKNRQPITQSMSNASQSS